MLNRKVKKLFKEQAEYYSIESSTAKSSPLVKLFLEWANKSPKKQIRVGEFGGAAGQLLAEIERVSPIKIDLYNVEIVKDYGDRQVSKKIKFFEGSILNAPFNDKFFDGLIIRDVLHHLVGKNLKETAANQEKALLELKRLIKPGGIVLIEELVTESQLSSRIIYGLSKLNSKFGFKSQSFEIIPDMIISFLTEKSLGRIISEIFEKEKIKIDKIPWNQELKSRLMHLGAKNWKMILAIKI